MTNIKSEHIEFMENNKRFLKILDTVLTNTIYSGKDDPKKRKVFFFFGQINNTVKWYISKDEETPDDINTTMVYQERTDGTLNGIPMNNFIRSMEYTLIQEFDDIPLQIGEMNEFVMDYLVNHKQAIVIDREQMERIRHTRLRMIS